MASTIHLSDALFTPAAQKWEQEFEAAFRHNTAIREFQKCFQQVSSPRPLFGEPHVGAAELHDIYPEVFDRLVDKAPKRRPEVAGSVERQRTFPTYEKKVFKALMKFEFHSPASEYSANDFVYIPDGRSPNKACDFIYWDQLVMSYGTDYPCLDCMLEAFQHTTGDCMFICLQRTPRDSTSHNFALLEPRAKLEEKNHAIEIEAPPAEAGKQAQAVSDDSNHTAGNKAVSPREELKASSPAPDGSCDAPGTDQSRLPRSYTAAPYRKPAPQTLKRAASCPPRLSRYPSPEAPDPQSTLDSLETSVWRAMPGTPSLSPEVASTNDMLSVNESPLPRQPSETIWVTFDNHRIHSYQRCAACDNVECCNEGLRVRQVEEGNSNNMRLICCGCLDVEHAAKEEE